MDDIEPEKIKFYERGNRGTIHTNPDFNAMKSCVKLFRAMRGVGANETVITDVLAYITFEQRQELRKKYIYVYKRNLTQVLEDELSSSYGKIVNALMKEPEEFILENINEAISPKCGLNKMMCQLSLKFSKGLSKSEHVLIDLLCCKSNAYLKTLKEAYMESYGYEISEKLVQEDNLLARDFCQIIEGMIAGTRDETDVVDMDQVNKDLSDLMDDGIKETALQAMLQDRSYPHIRRVFVEYRKSTGNVLQTILDSSAKFSDGVKSAYVCIFTRIRNEQQFYAERLKVAVNASSRCDDTLIRIIVLRSEVDLLDILEAYQGKCGFDLASSVDEVTKGDYRDILIKLIRLPDEKERKDREKAAARNQEFA